MDDGLRVQLFIPVHLVLDTYCGTLVSTKACLQLSKVRIFLDASITRSVFTMRSVICGDIENRKVIQQSDMMKVKKRLKQVEWFWKTLAAPALKEEISC